MKGWLVGLCLGVVALGIWWLVPYVAHWAQSPQAPVVSPTPPTLEWQGVNLVEYSGGSKLWDLSAERVDYDTEGKVAHLSRIAARFWEGGRVVSTAQAPKAELVTGSRDLTMGGGIRVASRMAATEVSADMVTWSAASQSLHASGSVSFSRGASTLRGPELWADRSLERVRVGSPMRARLRFDTGWERP